MTWTKLLENALLLDSETISLTRGTGVHELAIYQLKSREVYEYILKPNLVRTTSGLAQDVVSLASSTWDIHEGDYSQPTWQAAISEQMKLEGGFTNQKAFSRFLHKNINKGVYPHLTGAPDDIGARERIIKQTTGRDLKILSSEVEMKDLLRAGGILDQAIEGKTIWIANAPFESSVLGAHAGALEAQGVQTGLKSKLETSGTSTNSLYVTGRKVNEARVLAQQTGDWTGVWKAYLANTPKPGEAAVRDIQDVIRAYMSYGQKLGLTKSKGQYFAAGLDTVYRLLGTLEDDLGEAKGKFLTKELHRAAEDIAVHGGYVLENITKYTGALQEVYEGTAYGKELEAQARGGKGLLAKAQDYFARLEYLSKDLRQINLLKRLERAQIAFSTPPGIDYQTSDIRGISWLTQQTPSGGEERIPVIYHGRTPYKSYEEVVDMLTKDKTYQDLDVRTIAKEFRDRTRSSNREKHLIKMGNYIQAREHDLARKMSEQADTILSIKANKRSVRRLALEGFDSLGGLKAAGAVMGGIAALGALWSMSGLNKPPERRPSLVSYDYEQWLANAQRFGGLTQSQEGMSPGGIQAETRKQVTDFGSPYRGIMGSQTVFHDQELLAEREKWLRQQYNIAHYDPEFGLFGIRSAFKMAMPQNRTFIRGEGSTVSYNGVTGKNLQEITVGPGWKVEADDADTIVLKRGGLRGAVAGFFGLNRGYTFRMAGVDAPELSHGDTSYHAPQPMAEANAQAFASLLASKRDVKILYDPTQMTYGRMMGVVIGDGQNLNFEVVRRGLAGHLAYGKQEDSIIDYQALGAIERQSVSSGRGMWSQPYYQAFYAAVGKERPTFNTLTKKDKLVENLNLMDTISLAETAQGQGMMSTALITEATRISNVFHPGVDEIKPAIVDYRGSHYGPFMQEMQRDLGSWIRTNGTGMNPNRYRSRGNYGKLDKSLVLDSLGTTNAIWAKRQYEDFERYKTHSRISAERKATMAAMQRDINSKIFNSPIGHHRM